MVQRTWTWGFLPVLLWCREISVIMPEATSSFLAQSSAVWNWAWGDSSFGTAKINSRASCASMRFSPASTLFQSCPDPRYSPPAKSQNRPDLSLRRLCEARGFWLVFLTWRLLFLSPRRPCLTVCRLLLRHLFQTADSRCHGAFSFRRRSAWVTPARRLSGNAETFAVMPHARRK